MTNERAMSRFSRWAMSGAAVVIVLAGMQAAAEIVAPTLLALVIATLLAPVVSWLRARGLPTGLALLVLVLATFVTGVAVIGVMYASALRLLQQLPVYEERFQFEADAFMTWLAALGIPLEALHPEVSSLGRVLLSGAAVAIGSLISGLSGPLLVLMLVMFALVSAATVPGRLQRAHAGAAGLLSQFGDFSIGVRSILWSLTLTNILTAVTFSLWFLLWGIDFAIFWGMLAFFLGFIPSIGLFIAAVPPLILAVLQYGIGTAASVAVGITVINLVFDQITKRKMGVQVNLSDLSVFLGFLLWTWVLGAIGALIAVPLTLLVRMILASDEQTRWLATLMEAQDTAIPTSQAKTSGDPAGDDHSGS